MLWYSPKAWGFHLRCICVDDQQSFILFSFKYCVTEDQCTLWDALKCNTSGCVALHNNIWTISFLLHSTCPGSNCAYEYHICHIQDLATWQVMMQNTHTIDSITINCGTCSIQWRCLKISSNTVSIASGIWIIHAVMHLWQVTSFVCQDFRKQCQTESEATVSHSTLIQIEGAFVWVDSQFAWSLLALNHLVLAFYCDIWGACWGAEHLLCQTFRIRLGEELYVETFCIGYYHVCGFSQVLCCFCGQWTHQDSWAVNYCAWD